MSSLPADAWFVVQVAPRSERTAASILEYKGYQPFAPIYLSRKRWSDRIKTLEEPLFPGYVFVRTPGTTVSGLLCSTPGVIRILSFGGRPTPVPDSEIDAVRRFTLLGKPLPTPYLNVGEKVEVRDGPFAGIVGIVREIKNRACLTVSIQLISQSVYVEVDEFQIRPVASATRACHSLQPNHKAS
ncbi:MAG TPA: transcription termination/antitermination NusG family protein [Terriglobales bacterium]|nr:transcription termination/antitermination NusG family protein [Terriglobales bacterium]